MLGGLRMGENLLLVHILILVSSDSGILLVLVFGDEIDNVLVGFLELHLVHSFSLVPVEEGLSLVEGAELRSKSLEHGLKGGGVGDTRDSHPRRGTFPRGFHQRLHW